MARGVKPGYSVLPGRDETFRSGQLDIDGQGTELDLETEGSGQAIVSPLDHRRIVLVHDQFCSEVITEPGSTAYVVDMAVGKDDGREGKRIEPGPGHIVHHRLGVLSEAAVDHDQFAGFDDIGIAVPIVGEIRSRYPVDAPDHCS